MGAYFIVIDALGMDLNLGSEKLKNSSSTELDIKKYLPLKISLHEYPQLKQLSWHVSGTDVLTPKEAFDIYENNWRHIKIEALEQRESDLIDALRYTFNAVSSDV
jgi:hypothetical protein